MIYNSTQRVGIHCKYIPWYTIGVRTTMNDFSTPSIHMLYRCFMSPSVIRVLGYM